MNFQVYGMYPNLSDLQSFIKILNVHLHYFTMLSIRMNYQPFLQALDQCHTSASGHLLILMM